MPADNRFKNRSAAPSHLRTKTEMRKDRLKPAPDQSPAAYYWQGHSYVALYDPALSTPMRPKGELSAAQLRALAAGRKLAGTKACPNCQRREIASIIEKEHVCLVCQKQQAIEDWQQEMLAIRQCAAMLLAQNALFLDTETTGLDEGAEIIEIAILDSAGAVLLESLVRPTIPIPADATAIHGLTDADLEAAPTWPAIAPVVAEILDRRLVVAHNAGFDSRMLRQTCRRFGLEAPAATWLCTMQMLTEWNGGRWPKLGEAARLAGADLRNLPRHRARYDAEICRRILVALASQVQAKENLA
ncbi:MAG TPA: 3'-5' exonuclease [Noviherbaspirillum sp.]|nr:3'-5' exonuclease [Noviherbaspirillum sp.]